MNKDFFNARVTGILSFAPRNNRVIQIYLMVEYAEEDEIVENAVHLARTLKYEFDGVHMMSQDICDKALKYIPKEIRVSL